MGKVCFGEAAIGKWELEYQWFRQDYRVLVDWVERNGRDFNGSSRNGRQMGEVKWFKQEWVGWELCAGPGEATPHTGEAAH